MLKLLFSRKVSLAFFVCAFPALVFSGCKTAELIKPPQPEYIAVFEARKEVVWNELVRLLDGFGIKTKDFAKGTIETVWVEGYSKRPFGALGGGIMGGQWKRRMKLFVTLRPVGENKTQVQLISRLQEKAPGGTQAFRWQSVRPDGQLEQELFHKLQERLQAQ